MKNLADTGWVIPDGWSWHWGNGFILQYLNRQGGVRWRLRLRLRRPLFEALRITDFGDRGLYWTRAHKAR